MLCYRHAFKDTGDKRVRNMKRFGWVVLAAAAVSTASPVLAQSYVSDAEPFISAVKSRDGDKATQLANDRPTVLNTRNAKGETALNIVIARSDELWTQFLLGKGADPNFAASNGDTVDLVDALRPALVVLVADAGLGTINAVRLSMAALDAQKVVVYVNRFDETDDLHRRNAQWLRSQTACDVVTDIAVLAERITALS